MAIGDGRQAQLRGAAGAEDHVFAPVQPAVDAGAILEALGGRHRFEAFTQPVVEEALAVRQPADIRGADAVQRAGQQHAAVDLDDAQLADLSAADLQGIGQLLAVGRGGVIHDGHGAARRLAQRVGVDQHAVSGRVGIQAFAQHEAQLLLVGVAAQKEQPAVLRALQRCGRALSAAFDGLHARQQRVAPGQLLQHRLGAVGLSAQPGLHARVLDVFQLAVGVGHAGAEVGVGCVTRGPQRRHGHAGHGAVVGPGGGGGHQPGEEQTSQDEWAHGVERGARTAPAAGEGAIVGDAAAASRHPPQPCR